MLLFFSMFIEYYVLKQALNFSLLAFTKHEKDIRLCIALPREIHSRLNSILSVSWASRKHNPAGVFASLCFWVSRTMPQTIQDSGISISSYIGLSCSIRASRARLSDRNWIDCETTFE